MKNQLGLTQDTDWPQIITKLKKSVDAIVTLDYK